MRTKTAAPSKISSGAVGGQPGRHVFSTASQLAFLSGLSRLLGLLRDLGLAWLMGTGPLADMLAWALRVPHIMRRLLAEGVLSLSLTQAFIETGLKRDGFSSQELFFSLSRLLCFFSLLLFVLSIPLLPFFASLFAGKEKATDLAFLFFLALPYIVCSVLAALSMAFLHAQEIFTVPALSPLIFNVLMIATLVPCAYAGEAAPILVMAGLSLAGCAQWLYQRYYVALCFRGGASRKKLDGGGRLRETCNSVARRILFALPSGLLAVSSQHLCLFVVMCALTEPGAGAALMYAERIVELPLGIIGGSLGTASLPYLTRCALVGAYLRLRRLLDCALHRVLLWILPATCGLLAVADCLTGFLFGHGRVNCEGLSEIATMLTALTLVLPACALIRVLVQVSMARGTAPGIRSSLLAVLITLLGCMIQIHPITACSLGLWAQVLFLVLSLRFFFAQHEVRFGVSWNYLLRALICAFCAGLAAVLVLRCGPADSEFFTLLCRLMVSVTAGLLAWVLALRFFCPADLARLLRHAWSGLRKRSR